MVVTFSLCTGYSSHHHPPWLHGTWLTSLNQEEFLRICPQQQHQILWVQQGHPQNIHWECPHILFYPVPLPQPSGHNQRCRAEWSSAPKSLNIPSGPSSHSMTSILWRWLSGSFDTPHMPSPHLFQVLFYVFLFAICCLTVFANLIAPRENK